MKKLLFSAFLGTLALNLQAQEEGWCGTDHYNEAIFANTPGLKTQMEEHLSRVTAGAYVNDDREEIVIPVVVHVLHDNGTGNITNEQVESGITMLNEDFNRENADADDTRNTADAPFLPVAASMEIRFELAKLDPDGNCTNGIQRRNTGSLSYNAGNNAKHYSSGGLDAWDRNYYFNIWIVNSINSEGGGTILGYAEFPYSGGSSNYGVIIRNDAYGTVGTASGDRTLSHEAGHCFGLFHTFQSGCHTGDCNASGDFCCDTPPVVSAQWSCVATQNTCDEIPFEDPYGFDAYDQFENFMSYSPCQNMFSEDQKTLVLGNFESIGMLENLADPTHNAAAGVGGPEVLCKAQFTSENATICADQTVQFFDDSYSNVTGYTWTFEGGTPASSDEANPLITYSTPGQYDVTLEVTDGISTETVTMENHVLVLPNVGSSLPYVQNFEGLDAIPDGDNFVIYNQNGDDPWELSTTVGYSGTHSAFLQNHGNDGESIDEFISGPIDLSGVDADDEIVFNFKYAYKKRFNFNDEWLRFYISKDCGQTWSLRKNLHGDGLSEERTGGFFVPDEEDWVQVDITTINSAYFSEDFRFKFQFTNDNGNNIYIDDINMYAASTAGLDKSTSAFDFTVYPNPTQGVLNLSLNLKQNSHVRVEILNAVGQSVSTVHNGALNAGKTTLLTNTTDMPTGLYFVRLTTENGETEVVRFVKN